MSHVQSQRISNSITNCRRIISCYFYTFLELLAVKINFFNKLLLSWRGPVFKNEVKMAEVTKKDKVLLIGSGIYPTECIIIAEEAGAKVVGIDNCKNIVKTSKKYLKKKGLENLVEIRYADGVNFSVEEYNVVFIAINVFPIELVLENLSKKLKVKTRILCKSIKNDIPEVLKQNNLDKIFKIEKKHNNPKTQSYLLIKKI